MENERVYKMVFYSLRWVWWRCTTWLLVWWRKWIIPLLRCPGLLLGWVGRVLGLLALGWVSRIGLLKYRLDKFIEKLINLWIGWLLLLMILVVTWWWC